MENFKFKLSVCVIDGVILEEPVDQWFDSNLIRPIGLQAVKNARSSTECIVAKNAFIVYQSGHTFGTTVFLTMEGFMDYIRVRTYLAYNGCFITFNGIKISYNV